MIEILKPIGLVGIVILAFVVGFFVGENADQQTLPTLSNLGSDLGGSSLVKGHPYSAKRVKVIQGHVFDIYLENGKRYLVSLVNVSGTPEEAKDQLIRQLNEFQQSGGKFIVIPRAWDESNRRWLVDCYFGDNQSVTNWLETRDLIYH